MKVIFITHYSGLYGANRSLIDMIVGLRDFHEITPIVLYKKSKNDTHGDFHSELEKRGIASQEVRFPIMYFKSRVGWLMCIIKIFFQYFDTLKLIRICGKINPDIIYSNSSIVDIGYVIAQKLHVKHFWHIREFGYADYKLNYFFGKQTLVSKLQTSFRVIFISSAICKNYYLGNEKYNGITINDGILKMDDISLKEKFVGLANNSILRMSIVGVIMESKGQFLAIKAFRKFLSTFSNAELHVYGECAEERYLERIKNYAKRENIESKVIFHGFQSNIQLIYENTDILLMCSKKEGLGRVTIEAMAKGIPVIGNSSGGTQELIEHGVNGLLYSKDSEVDLLNQMVYLVSSPELFEVISRNALEHSKKFTIDNYAKRIYHLLNE